MRCTEVIQGSHNLGELPFLLVNGQKLLLNVEKPLVSKFSSADTLGPINLDYSSVIE